MNDFLTIAVIDNDRGGHDDLLFSIPDLIGDRKFDSYYFRIAIEPVEGIDELRNAVSHLLQYWKDKILESKSGEALFLPIDFSDEYTGCLKVRNEDERLALTYGFSQREGWSVSPLDPGNYYCEITDFESESGKFVTVEKPIFISTIEKQIEKLKGWERRL